MLFPLASQAGFRLKSCRNDDEHFKVQTDDVLMGKGQPLLHLYPSKPYENRHVAEGGDFAFRVQ